MSKLVNVRVRPDHTVNYDTGDGQGERIVSPTDRPFKMKPEDFAQLGPVRNGGTGAVERVAEDAEPAVAVTPLTPKPEKPAV